MTASATKAVRTAWAIALGTSVATGAGLLVAAAAWTLSLDPGEYATVRFLPVPALAAAGAVVLFMTALTLALSRPVTAAARAELLPVLVLAAVLGLIGLAAAAAALPWGG